jgi:aspartate 1-decarboxylase
LQISALTVFVKTGTTSSIVVTIESQPAIEVSVTSYDPAVVTVDPSGNVYDCPLQISAVVVDVRTGTTSRIVVTIESHPATEVNVTSYDPAVVTVDPSGNVYDCPLQISALTVFVKTGTTSTIVVIIESHPATEVSVTSYDPAVVTVEPSGSVYDCPLQISALTIFVKTGTTLSIVVTIESHPAIEVNVT